MHETVRQETRSAGDDELAEKAEIQKEIDASMEKLNEEADAFNDAQGPENLNQKILLYMEWTKKRLKDELCIDGLSVFETLELRHVVESLLPKYEREKTLVDKHEMSALELGEIETESAALWLYDQYGIHPKDVPHIYIVEDVTTKEKFVFQQTMKKEAEKKRADIIKATGHYARILNRVPDDFKEYLRRTRIRAHHKTWEL